MPTGTYGGVRGWGREAPAYSILTVGPIRMTQNSYVAVEKNEKDEDCHFQPGS